MPQAPAPAGIVVCRALDENSGAGAEAALAEAGCNEKLTTGGAKLSGAVASSEVPAAGKAIHMLSQILQ